MQTNYALEFADSLWFSLVFSLVQPNSFLSVPGLPSVFLSLHRCYLSKSSLWCRPTIAPPSGADQLPPSGADQLRPRIRRLPLVLLLVQTNYALLIADSSLWPPSGPPSGADQLSHLLLVQTNYALEFAD